MAENPFPRDGRLVAGILALLLAWAGWSVPAMAAPGTIHSARAHLEFSGGYTGAETLAQLQQALDSVVQAALIDQLGGDLDYVVANKKDIVTTLGGAIGKVLSSRGFNLLELSLDPGSATTVDIQLGLSAQRVHEIDVRFFILGNTPLVNAVVEPDASEIATALYATLARTPVGDPAWLKRLVTQGVEAELAKRPAYADFVHEVFAEPGETTHVVVAFTPQPGAVLIASQQLKLHSVTILNSQLAGLRDQTGYFLTGLVGAPRSFVQAKQQALSDALFRELSSGCTLLADCPDAAISLALDSCQLTADFNVESQRSLLQASARLDLRGTNKPGTIYGRLRLRGGTVPKKGWAVYGGGDYYPGDDKLYTIAGVARLLDSRGFVGAGYDFQSQSLRFEGQHDLSPEAYISADYFSNHNYNRLSEVALHWRVRQAYELQLAASFDGGLFAAVAAAY